MRSLANLRDVASASPRLRPGVLLRADAPLPGDRHEGYDVRWPPRTVVDLRGWVERGGTAHPLAGQASVVHRSLLRGTGYPSPHLVSELPAFYRSMLRAPVAERVVEVVGHLATGQPPLLVHCTAGKDRTGVVVAVTLALAGLDRDEIIADYLRTTPVMGAVAARMRRSLAGVLTPELLDHLPPAYRTAPRAAAEALLDELAAERGGTGGWFVRHGGSADVLDTLRTRLLAR